MAERFSKLFFVMVFVFILSSCTTSSNNANYSNATTNPDDIFGPYQNQAAKIPTEVIEPTVTIHPPQTPQNTLLPIINNAMITSTVTPDTRLTADRWREWPVVPTLSSRALNIIQSALKNPALDPHVFSKVGDCQFTTATFLAGYVKGDYSVPEGLEATTHYFKESMARDSITAWNGLGINSVLNPLFAAGAGYKECYLNETPLDCELRTRRPAVVLVSMGTNWKPYAEITFEDNLRQVVDKILATGALPILATKADNIEKDWKLNLANAKVAYDYDLPLVNVWRSVQSLPNNGLCAPNNVYLTGNGWLAQNYAWLRTLDSVQFAIEN